MRHRGWLLDPYLDGKNIVYWFKTDKGKAVKAVERHNPIIVVKPKPMFTTDNLVYLFEEHPFVISANPVKRYDSIHRDSMGEYVEVKIDTAEDLEIVQRYAQYLPEVEEVFNVGLVPVQWHLIYRGLKPSGLYDFSVEKEKLTTVSMVNDWKTLEPPGFKEMFIDIPDGLRIKKATVSLDDWEEKLEGRESNVLRTLNMMIGEEDPDIIVMSDPRSLTRHILSRARRKNVDIRFGRDGERYRGRILLGKSTYHSDGIVGLVERARFTYAPIGLSFDWEPGKTIDSRQCAEAVKMDVVVPGMNGGYGFRSTAWDMMRSDRGGMIFSPKAGFHENVAALDFESMFPHIIVNRNVSYETVTEEGIDTSKPGFMGSFMKEFLKRRLDFKREKENHPHGSEKWLWAHQRQAALKLMLVVIYGYCGCYSNRFANVRVFQEINREARRCMVAALRVAQGDGFDVIYGPFDSLFVKKKDASKNDYHELGKHITEETKLPMNMDNHFKYLALLTKTSDPMVVTANRFYAKLMNGNLFYRGIELRRHDTPTFIRDMQTGMITAMFRHDSLEEVATRGVSEAHDIASNAITKIRLGKVNPHDLVISKRLRRELNEYKARQPHIVAALLDTDKEMSEYILMNTESPNPYLRVLPKSQMDKKHRGYDKKKYEQMVRRAAWNLLRPFVPGEASIGTKLYERTRLDRFV